MVPAIVNPVHSKGSSSVATNSANTYATLILTPSAGAQIALKETQTISERSAMNVNLRLPEATGMVGTGLKADHGARNTSKSSTSTPPGLSLESFPCSQLREYQRSRFGILARCRPTVSFSNPCTSGAVTVNANDGKTLRQFFSRGSIASISSFVTLMSQVFSPRKESSNDTSTAQTEPPSSEEEVSSTPLLRQAVQLGASVSQAFASSIRGTELSIELLESTKLPQAESLVNLDLPASPPVPIPDVYRNQGSDKSLQVALSVRHNHNLLKEIWSKPCPMVEDRKASASVTVQSQGSFFSDKGQEKHLAIEEKRISKRNKSRKRKLRDDEYRIWIQRRKVYWDAGVEFSRKDAVKAMSYEASKMIDLIVSGEFSTRQQFRYIREMASRWVTIDQEVTVCQLSYVRLGIKWQIALPTAKTMTEILIPGRVASGKNLRFPKIRRVRRKESLGYVNEVDIQHFKTGVLNKNPLTALTVEICKTSLTDPGVKLATKEKVMLALCLLVDYSDPHLILDKKDYVEMAARSDRGQTIPFHELARCATNFALKDDLANLKREKAQIIENMEFGATSLVGDGYKNCYTGVGSSWGAYW